MSQHFLLSAKARTLSVLKVARMADEEAFKVFKELRWGAGDEVTCPCCGVIGKHAFRKDRRQWHCIDCGHTFSVTAGTIFANHKLPLKTYLAALAIYANAAKGFRHMQYGQTHKFGNLYLANYANEAAFREDTRRQSNGAIFLEVAKRCAKTHTSRDWCGYWQGNKREAERLAA